jgi:hypothetical protein
MNTVSDAWKDIQQRFLLPETHIEIDCGITDDEAQSLAVASGTDETVFSNASGVVDGLTDVAKYATLEHNLWALDGTNTVLPASGTYSNAGYVSNIESTGSVTVSFPAIRTNAISGITITWSEKYAEYAKTFTVIGRNGNTIVGEVTVTNNKSRVSIVYLPLNNYNSITIQVHEWCLPRRRVRIEKVVIGHVLKFGKGDLLSYTHEMDGDLLSGKIPKYSIEFTLNNNEGQWDPNNPSGMAQYLSERQRITVKYGLDVNGTIEWIKAGTFYLSEWHAPPNALEARFVARDVFEFLLATDTTKLPNMSSTQYGNLANIITWATATHLPEGASVVIDDSLKNSKGRQYNGDGTYAEMVQKCAHAGCCILRYDRNGVLHIEPLNNTVRDYIPITVEGATGIPLSLSFSYPEITLSKPLKTVIVDYGGESPYQLDVSNSGELQTVSNDYILNEESAIKVAEWVANVLKTRKTVSGEFRADPRLDLYDIVRVEDRYSHLLTVAITNIRYTFNGSFRGTFTGRILEEG